MFSFEVDEDGEIFINEIDVFDLVCLVFVLYMKYFWVCDCNGEV